MSLPPEVEVHHDLEAEGIFAKSRNVHRYPRSVYRRAQALRAARAWRRADRVDRVDHVDRIDRIDRGVEHAGRSLGCGVIYELRGYSVLSDRASWQTAQARHDRSTKLMASYYLSVEFINSLASPCPRHSRGCGLND